MNFIKKMCILRQVRQGFSSDGKVLSGLIKVEQYGNNLSIEVSVINFAPLSSGEYYCLIADEKNRTELLPLRGKSIFNIITSLDLSTGFCGIICFLKNDIIPVAYGVNGDKTYDFHALVNAAVLPKKSKTSETAVAEIIPEESYKEDTNIDKNIIKKENYDDEVVAANNYYERGNENEWFSDEKSNDNAYIESRYKGEEEEKGKREKKDGNIESIFESPEKDEHQYYSSIKKEIDEIFSKYPKTEALKELFPFSEWVKVEENEKLRYLIGVIYEEGNVKYICYAFPTTNKDSPPEEISNVAIFVPCNFFSEESGFFIIFQNPKNGECIHIDKI